MRWGWGMGMLVVLVASAGCYDSRWGQRKAAQQNNAAYVAPAELHADDEARSDDRGPLHVQKLRVRALVTPAFSAQVIDTPKHLRELFEDVNAVTERDVGVRLELTETRNWDLADDGSIDRVYDALHAHDDGAGVDWVIGFVGSLPRATRSFHEVGKGSLVGKHIVVRAASSAERHDGIERSFDELPLEQRRDLEKRLRRHRAAAVLLHELGHTLGSVHETSPKSIMFPEYNSKMSAFGPSANDVMRADLAKRDSSDIEIAKAVATALERAPSEDFVVSERDALVSRLTKRSAYVATPPPAPAEPVVPETPELKDADRERFVEAYRAASRGDAATAWSTGKPLFSAHPKSMAVQDLRCRVATQIMAFDLARRECNELMKLSTAAGN